MSDSVETNSSEHGESAELGPWPEDVLSAEDHLRLDRKILEDAVRNNWPNWLIERFRRNVAAREKQIDEKSGKTNDDSLKSEITPEDVSSAAEDANPKLRFLNTAEPEDAD